MFKFVINHNNALRLFSITITHMKIELRNIFMNDINHISE